MITTEKKPFEEILNLLEDVKTVFIVGCSRCATLCETGGEAEVEDLRLKLEKSGKTVTGGAVFDVPCHMQRTKKDINLSIPDIQKAEAVVVLSCGAGVQSLSELLPEKIVIPGLNSLFLGNVVRYGYFEERCSMCGECLLGITMGICPVTRCAKSLVNGPCGGSREGKCEVDNEKDCAWELIFQRFKKAGRLDLLEKFQPMKDFQISIKPGVVDIRKETQDERADRISRFKLQKERIRRYFEKELQHRHHHIEENRQDSPVSRLQEKLEKGEFIYTCEIVPPKGVNVEEVLGPAREMKNFITAFSINENPGAIMRVGSLSMSAIFAREGMEPILHLTTRERNRLALQSELLGAYVMGIRNVLAMTGDHQSVGDHKEAKPVYDLDSVQLLRLATELTRGRDYNANPLDGAPQYFLGGVVNPRSHTFEMEILKMKKKCQAGASFFITQAVYDIEVLKRFLEAVDKSGIKTRIIAGIIPVKSRKMAEYMNDNIPGIIVPESMMEKIDKGGNIFEKKKIASEMALEIIEQCKGLVDGVHLIPIGWYDIIPNLVKFK